MTGGPAVGAAIRAVRKRRRPRDPNLFRSVRQTRFEVTMNEHVQTVTTDPLFDPLSPDFIKIPYPAYERLRSTDPMHVTSFGAFLASRHAEASIVLRDKRFGKDFVERSKRRYGPDIMS